MPRASVNILDDKGLTTNVMSQEQAEQLLEQNEKVYEQLVELNHQMGKLIAVLLDDKEES